MLRDLDLADENAKAEGFLRAFDDLQQAVERGAVTRVRPEFMTVAARLVKLVDDHAAGEM